AFGFGGNPLTPSGWPSFYIEEMVGHAQCQQTVLASLVLEGVFERYPKLKMVMIEAGFGWVPSLGWRLDKNFERLHSEVPYLKRKPSEYIRDHIWWTTQPMWSRIYSDGLRLRYGTSLCSRSKFLSSRQPSDGAQPKPASIMTIFSLGYRSNTPSSTRLASTVCWHCAWPTISSI